jgi:hypothetical protein
MTTNEKTEGVLVSRELIERIAHWGSVTWADKNELRALLNVPTCKTPIGTACPGDGVGPCKKCSVTTPQREPEIAGNVLDSYDYAIADLDPEKACTYLSNGEVAQLVGAVRTLQVRFSTQPESEPDAGLCDFYSVTDYPGLVRELVGHVALLQESAKRNVKPWEDTFPPTLLPAYVERVNAANSTVLPRSEPVAPVYAIACRKYPNAVCAPACRSDCPCGQKVKNDE